jgi:hypothetical protein
MEVELRTPQHPSEYRLQFDAGTTFTGRLTGGRESAAAPAIIGLIPTAKGCKSASATAAAGSHEVICRFRTILQMSPSTAPTATG